MTDPPPRENDGQLKQGTDDNQSPGDPDYSRADALKRARDSVSEFAKHLYPTGTAEQKQQFSALLSAALAAQASPGGPRGGSLEDPGVLHHAQLHDKEADGKRDVEDVREVADTRGVLPRGSYRLGRIYPEPGVQEPEDRAPAEVHSGVPGTVGDFTKIAFPVVRRVVGGLIANQIVSIQPMSLPAGGVFYTHGNQDIELRIFYDDQPDRPGRPKRRSGKKAARDR